MKTSASLPFLLCLLWLTACGGPSEPLPAPQEPVRDTVGYYCGMTLAEHAGPKGQIQVAGVGEPLWFASVRELFVYLQTEGTTRRILAVYVNDMGRADWDHPQPGTWILAQTALFVMGSHRNSGMGEMEVVPFGKQSEAELFAHQQGGRVVSYSEVIKSAPFSEMGSGRTD